MIVEKHIILTPCHPTWDVFQFLKTHESEKSRKLKSTINGKKYIFSIEVISENIQGVECVELIEVEDKKCKSEKQLTQS